MVDLHIMGGITEEAKRRMAFMTPEQKMALGITAATIAGGAYAVYKARSRKSRKSKKTFKAKVISKSKKGGRIWKDKIKGKLDRFEKGSKKKINGISLKAIRNMLASPKTPPHLKKYWRGKLKLRGR